MPTGKQNSGRSIVMLRSNSALILIGCLMAALLVFVAVGSAYAESNPHTPMRKVGQNGALITWSVTALTILALAATFPQEMETVQKDKFAMNILIALPVFGPWVGLSQGSDLERKIRNGTYVNCSPGGYNCYSLDRNHQVWIPGGKVLAFTSGLLQTAFTAIWIKSAYSEMMWNEERGSRSSRRFFLEEAGFKARMLLGGGGFNRSHSLPGYSIRPPIPLMHWK